MFGRKQSPVQTSWCWEGLAYLAVVIAILAGALVREINLLFMAAGLMAGPLLWSWWWGRGLLRHVTVRRRLPRSVCAGDLLVVELELANHRSRGGCWALVVEESFSHEKDRQACSSAKIYIPFLPAGGRQTASYRGRLTERGRYQMAPVRLSTRFPFGLFRHSIQLGQTEQLVVYPRIGRLTQRWTARQQQAFEGAQRREQHSGRAEGDFYGVRPWRTGDSQRWIHWRASARHQSLVVRQFEQYRNRDLAVLLDLWQPTESGPQDQEHVEWAVSFAAALIAQACRKGVNRLGLAIVGQQGVWLTGPASTGLLDDALEHLALAQPSAEDSLSKVLDPLAQTFRKGAEIVVIRAYPAGPTETSLPERKPQLLRRLAGAQLLWVDVTDPQFTDYFLPP